MDAVHTASPSIAASLPIQAHPSRDLFVIGITGTNGKTTVSYLIGEVLKAAGFAPFVLGTLNSGSRDLSTPVAADIARFMDSHLRQGGTHFIMEVTSEGIDQDRLRDVDFDIKVLTNITQDHLDYHKTLSSCLAPRGRMESVDQGQSYLVMVVLAGKGHETSQIVNFEEVHFDDREEAQNAICADMKTKTRPPQC